MANVGHDEVDRWFIHRGVPHFIEGYDARTDIWTRAAPILLLAYLVGGLQGLDIAGWSVGRNVLAAVVVLAVLAVTWAVTNAYRRREFFAWPDVIGAPELAAFLVGPAIPAAIFGQWGDAVQVVVEGVGVLIVIYVVTSYGLIPLVGWAARRSATQIGSLGRVVARVLPLLLLFTTFLFISAELWQVAGTLAGLAYVLTLAIFFLLGAAFVLSRVPAATHGLATFADWGEICALVAGTPAEPLPLPASGVPPAQPLGTRQRVNVGLLSVFSQALQVTFVVVVLVVFFVVFGFVAIPEETAASWVGAEEVHVFFTLSLDGRDLVITEPLIRVAGFLGAFTGMYFTVVLSTDATYRDEVADDLVPQIRQALAVRAAATWANTAGSH